MSATTPASEPTARAVLVRLLRIGEPPWAKLALATLLGVAGALATVGLLAGSGYVVDRAAFRPGLGAIAGVLAGVEVLAFLRGPLRYAERLVAHDAAFRSLERWRVWLFDRLEPLAPAGLREWRAGDLLTRLTDDTDTLQDLTLRCLLPVCVTIAAATLAVVVVSIVLPVAGGILAAALLVASVSAPAAALRSARASRRQAALRAELTADVVDLLRGAPELVAFGRVSEAMATIERTDSELTTIDRRRSLAAGLSTAVVTVCVGAAVTGVLAAGIAALRAHQLDPVLLGVLPLATIGAFETVPAVAMAAVRAAEVAAAGRRLLALEGTPVPVVDPPSPDPLPGGSVDFELAGARLRYGADLPWAIDGADLSFRAGTQIGVVGPSGSGKSSLVHVLVRFWPLESGDATLGGVALERLAQADIRAAIALVDQDAHLFAGTIRENLTLGRPRASEPEIADALRLAQLEDWVATLERGIDTQVGEEGAQVSGGQRRRIALARALLVGSPVLVLDEPTAGLDRAAGERLVADVLEAARARGASVLLVTHRESELDGFDQVVALDRGRTIRDGGARPHGLQASRERPGAAGTHWTPIFCRGTTG